MTPSGNCANYPTWTSTAASHSRLGSRRIWCGGGLLMTSRPRAGSCPGDRTIRRTCWDTSTTRPEGRPPGRRFGSSPSVCPRTAYLVPTASTAN